MSKLYITATVFIWILTSTSIHAEVYPQALLDLATCYGANLPSQAFRAGEGKDTRILRMEQTLVSIKHKNGFKPAEIDGFYEPDKTARTLTFPIHFIGLKGFGPFRGMNLTLGGNFNTIKRAVEEEVGIQYNHCKNDPRLHLSTCHQDMTGRYSHLIMTHPHNPKYQTVLICVDNQI